MPILKQINKTKVPIKIWSRDIEETALEQAIVIANTMPVYSHVALMPDVHAGKGMPIGGVVALMDAICPSMVGVDIGCGVLAVKTNLTDIPLDKLEEIFERIYEYIPVGFNRREKPVHWNRFEEKGMSETVKDGLSGAMQSLGTLGGGNHFIEVQKGSDGHIWIMIHSGSRKFGYDIAEYYQEMAHEFGVSPNGNKNLAYFPTNTDDPNVMALARQYINDMNFALDYAYRNRLVMNNDVFKAFREVLGQDGVTSMNAINIHHNYATPVRIDEGTGWLHRKGATEATIHTMGIIPGSQGTPSYIVMGRGNEESFQSCSHGAGRVMSRSKAKKTLDKDECLKKMAAKGLQVNPDRFSLDEDDASYKDIVQVMENQNDLVSIEVKLTPYKISAIKG